MKWECQVPIETRFLETFGLFIKARLNYYHGETSGLRDQGDEEITLVASTSNNQVDPLVGNAIYSPRTIIW